MKWACNVEIVIGCKGRQDEPARQASKGHTMNTIPLVTVTVKAADDSKRTFDLPRDGIADASSVRSLNAAAKGGMIVADAADDMRALADACAHSALEAGRDAMSMARTALKNASPLDRAAHLKALLKLRVRRTF